MHLIFLKLFCALMLDGFESTKKNQQMLTDENEEDEEGEVELHLNQFNLDSGVDEKPAGSSPSIKTEIEGMRDPFTFSKGQSPFDLSNLLTISNDRKKNITNNNRKRRETILARFDMSKHLNLKNEFTYFKKGDTKKSLFIFSKSNRIRKFCYRVSKSPYFDKLKILMIIVSCVNLSFETFIDEEEYADYQAVSYSLNAIANIFFCFETFILIISVGLIMGKTSYLREFLNILDIIATISFILDSVTDDRDFPAFRVL